MALALYTKLARRIWNDATALDTLAGEIRTAITRAQDVTPSELEALALELGPKCTKRAKQLRFRADTIAPDQLYAVPAWLRTALPPP